jgi:hypothetical protein
MLIDLVDRVVKEAATSIQENTPSPLVPPILVMPLVVKSTGTSLEQNDPCVRLFPNGLFASVVK